MGSLNPPDDLFVPGGSLLVSEARLRQEGSVGSGALSGLAGQTATTPSSFLPRLCFALSAWLLFFDEEARLSCCSPVGSRAQNLLYLEVILHILMPMVCR